MKAEKSKFILFLAVLTLLVAILKHFESLTFFSHSDPLFYHLPLARYWLLWGLDETYRNLCNGLVTGYFDHLYLLTVGLSPTLWMGQLSSQFLHTLCSLGLGAAITYYYFRDRPILAHSSAIAILTIAGGATYFLYAKNDGVLASVGLLSAIVIFDSKHKSNPIIVGLLLGLLPAIKMNGLFLTIPMALIFTFDQRKRPMNVVLSAIIAFGVWSPILLRNYYYIGNPFFPGLLNHFPGTSSEAMIETYTGFMSSSPSLSSTWENTKIYLLPKIFLITFPFIFSKAAALKNWRYLVTSLSFFFFYLLTNGGVVSYRFLFPVAFLNIFVYFLFLSEKKSLPRFWPYLLILIVLIDSKVDHSVKRLTKLPAQFQELHHDPKTFLNRETPNTQFWDHLPQTDQVKIITDTFHETYYAPENILLHCNECSPQAGFLYTCESETDIEQLKQYNYAILLTSKIRRNKDNPCYQHILEANPIHEVPYYGEVYRLYEIRKN